MRGRFYSKKADKDSGDYRNRYPFSVTSEVDD